MAVRSGIAGQVGSATESTYGTGVTVTKFNYASKVDFKKVKNVEQGQALAGALRAARHGQGAGDCAALHIRDRAPSGLWPW